MIKQSPDFPRLDAEKDFNPPAVEPVESNRPHEELEETIDLAFLVENYPAVLDSDIEFPDHFKSKAFKRTVKMLEELRELWGGDIPPDIKKTRFSELDERLGGKEFAISRYLQRINREINNDINNEEMGSVSKHEIKMVAIYIRNQVDLKKLMGDREVDELTVSEMAETIRLNSQNALIDEFDNKGRERYEWKNRKDIAISGLHSLLVGYLSIIASGVMVHCTDILNSSTATWLGLAAVTATISSLDLSRKLRDRFSRLTKFRASKNLVAEEI